MQCIETVASRVQVHLHATSMFVDVYLLKFVIIYYVIQQRVNNILFFVFKKGLC